MTDQSPARARLGWLAPLFLALLSVAIYAPTLKHKLVYDDSLLILNNSSMAPVHTSLGSAFALFAREYWDGANETGLQGATPHPAGQALYRPLTLFAWALIVNLSGTERTWPFHLLSILCNAFVVVLLQQAVCRLWRQPTLAFVTALLFALHPLHSEAVAYVAGLSDVLSAGAVLLGLIFWERATSQPGVLRRGAYAGLLITLFVGLLAKEQTVILIAAVALTDLMFAWRGENRGGIPRAAVYAGMAMVTTAHLLLRYAVIGYLRPDVGSISPTDNPLVVEPFVVRLLTGVKIMAMETWLFLWPKTLSIDYSFNAIPVSRTLSQPETAIGCILLLILLLYGIVMLRKRPAIGWGVLLFLGCALFMSSILVPIGTIFGERLMYLSSAGACLVVAALLLPWLPGQRGATGGAGAALGLVVVLAAAGLLGIRTWERNKDFESSETLFESALKVVPESARVHFQLGALYAGQALYNKAEERYTRALQIDDRFMQAAIGLGDVHYASRNWDKAIEVYTQILNAMIYPPKGQASFMTELSGVIRAKLAGAKAAKGDLDGAAADLRLAMQTDGADNKQRVIAHIQLAQLQLDRGKPAEAIQVLREALKLEPANLKALYMLARTSFDSGDTEVYAESLAGLEKTQAGRPLALALKGEQLYNEADEENDVAKRQQAINLFEEVRESNPELGTPYIYRARFMFENGRYADAILECDLALQRAPRHPGALLQKAMAQIYANRPEDALVTAQELALIAPDVSCYEAMFYAHSALGDLTAMEADAKKLEELGGEPAELFINRAITLQDNGQLDEAITAIEQGRLIAAYRDNARLLRSLGALLLDARRYDEALVAFQQQDVAERSSPEVVPDLFLPVNRARALMGLGRDMEAATELELFESRITPDSPGWPSLLHRRAQLFLHASGPFYNPAKAADMCDEGLTITKNRFPALLDTSIEALVAKGDLPAAIARARLASREFPTDKRYTVAIEALDRAQSGDTAAALPMLRQPKAELLDRLASILEG